MARARSFHTLSEPPRGLLEWLEQAAPGRVHARPSDRLAYAHDASHYQLTPAAVVTAAGTDQVAALMRDSTHTGNTLTFRSGGTSLSGQASSDGVMVDTRRHFRDIEVLDGGDRVRCGPGATVRAVNARLARHARKLGPDPASEVACTIGGVIANNSSGMACGVTANTYRTLESCVLALPSGTVINTADPDADQQLRDTEPRVHAGLATLRDRVRTNPESAARIRELFAIKNTMGYAVNAFLDFDAPIDILQHLVIGSEGTLAFVAEATFRTVPVHPQISTGLLIFADLTGATGALPALVQAGFATIELMDATSLRVAQTDPGAADVLRALEVQGHAALLVEFHDPDQASLDAHVTAAQALFGTLPLAQPAQLSTDPGARAALWHIRKGLYTLVAGNRPAGTTALLEDIAVPVAQLLPVCTRLIELFHQYGYRDSVIFGHARDGNIHFMLNETFTGDHDRYLAFTEDMVALVLGAGGTLKAEHGTGRIMAPFVRRQYGDELYQVMVAVKQLIDPSGILNPDVLISADPDVHVKHLKSTATVEAEVDRCVECGYCEPVCPSRDLTTTPRQRIVLRRELARAEQAGDTELAALLTAEYQYDSIDTCAVDGMCQTACPVTINTADLVRRLRAERAGAVEQAGWKAAAQHWGVVTRAGGAALTVASAVPAALPHAATTVGRAILGPDTVPTYSADLPSGGSPRNGPESEAAEIVYFSSCINTMFGPAPGSAGVSDAFTKLCERAGVAIRVPTAIPNLCCGTPWKSKGMTDGFALMQRRVREALLQASDSGRLPIVCDAASCTEGLEVLLSAAPELTIIDAVEFIDRRVLPALPAATRVPRLVLHPTCSSTRLGTNAAMTRIAEAVADEVIVPDEWSCCAFAGDRGMLHPELAAAATAPGAREVSRMDASAYASTNRTCEIGMSRATGKDYQHILEVLAGRLG